MSKYAVIRADLNSNEQEVLSTHKTETAAVQAASKYDGTTGAIGLYIAQRKPGGDYESRLEARDRREGRIHALEEQAQAQGGLNDEERAEYQRLRGE